MTEIHAEGRKLGERGSVVDSNGPGMSRYATRRVQVETAMMDKGGNGS